MSDPHQPGSGNIEAARIAPALTRPSRGARVWAWFARMGRVGIRGLAPGAILDKELRIQGRRAGTYWIRFGYASVMAIFVGLTLASVFSRALGGDSAATLSVLEQFQRSGPIVLISLAWMQFIGMSLAAAVFTSPLVCEERRAGTLGTLLTTPLTAWQIVVGKASGALVQLVILGLIGLPILLGVRVFGGISGELVIAAIATLVGATIGCCALGILASTVAPRQSSAIASAIMFTMAWYAAPPLVGLGLESINIAAPWPELLMFSPAAGMVMLHALVEGGVIISTPVVPFWVLNLACSLLVAIAAFLIATLRLRVLMRQVGAGRDGASSRASSSIPGPNADPESQQSPATKLTRRERRQAERRERARSLAAARSVSRTVGDQPVLWRELRQPVTTRPWLAWAGGIGVASIIAYAFWASREGEVVGGIISMIGMVVSIMIVAGTSGGALGQERESRSWETLLTTPLTAGQILVGKLAGILVRLRFIWLFLFGTLAIAAIGWDLHPLIIIHFAILLLSTTFFVSCLGLFFSAITKRSIVAIMATMGSVLGIWLVLPIAALMCAAAVMLGGEDDFVSAVAVTNPFAWAIVTIEGANDFGSDFEYHVFDFGRVGPVAFTVYLSIFAAVYAGFGMVFLGAARHAVASATLRQDPTITPPSQPPGPPPATPAGPPSGTSGQGDLIAG